MMCSRQQVDAAGWFRVLPLSLWREGLKKLGWGRMDREKQISLDRMRGGYRHVSAGMSRNGLVFWIYSFLKTNFHKNLDDLKKRNS